MEKNLISKAESVFQDYIKQKNLKYSQKRVIILNSLLRSKKHLTAEELYQSSKAKDASIGIATVYRTLKLLCECGIAQEIKFSQETPRYEPVWGHEHHDHLICILCGKFEEVIDKRIEKLQEELAQKYGFILTQHKLELYGICNKCR